MAKRALMMSVGSPQEGQVVTFTGGMPMWADPTGEGGSYTDADAVAAYEAARPVIYLSKATNQNVGGGNGTEVWWTWDGEIIKETGYTHSNDTNPSRVTVANAGWYHVRFVGNVQQAGSARSTLQGILRVNGGVTQRPGTIRDYTRGSGYGNLSPGLEAVVQLSAGQYVEVGTRVEDTDSAYTLNTNGNEVGDDENRLLIQRLR